MLPFTPEQLAQAVTDGHVTARRHPSLPYTIYNYSNEVQYTNQWDEVTLNCRGLILDDDFNIIARPWKKFFNLGQVNLPIQFDTPVEVMDKADGSLGILYPMPRGEDGYQHYAVATRGSFASEQAIKATEIWNAKYAEPYETVLEALDEAYTFLFEIIYPENRIVLDYGDTEDLILLGAVQNENGYYYGPQYAKAMLDWKGPVVETFDYNTISDALAVMDRGNAEGYVIRSHNFMVKLKQPDYLELNRLVTNASPKTVWEQLKQGKSKTEIISAFPDEFHDYIGSMIDPLVEQFNARLDDLFAEFSRVSAEYNRKHQSDESFDRGQYARFISKHPDKKYLFLLLDNKSIREILWTELKPRESKVSNADV
jgi:RNA ligase